MKATEAAAISSNPDMTHIFEWIKQEASKGKTSTLLPPVSDAQVNVLKSLGYTITYYCNDEFTGAHKCYWAGLMPKVSGNTLLNKVIDSLSFSQEKLV